MGHIGDIKSMRFDSYFRRMKLLLTENKDIFGPSFSVSIVRADGREQPLKYNPDVFYKGVVEGIFSSLL